MNHFRHDRNPQEYEMNVQILNRRMQMHDEFDKDGLGSLQYIVVNSTSVEVAKCKTHFTRVQVLILDYLYFIFIFAMDCRMTICI